jgi:hypothetical protein
MLVIAALAGSSSAATPTGAWRLGVGALLAAALVTQLPTPRPSYARTLLPTSASISGVIDVQGAGRRDRALRQTDARRDIASAVPRQLALHG